MIVLGIETSCDETAVAVVCDHPGPVIRSNLIHSQLAEHAPYGGVVPEIAARAHLDQIAGLIGRALAEAGTSVDRLDGVAAAAGPGLIGGLIVGSMAAKGLAWAAHKPYMAVNHLEAHALAARLSPGVEFPYLLLLVSGGHTQLLVCAGVGRYRQLGTSRDDAAGEAFDKSAKLLGLGYPGGPAIEEAARTGDPARFALPRPLKGRAGCDFSFSGLKTAVRHIVADMDARAGPLGPQDMPNPSPGLPPWGRRQSAAAHPPRDIGGVGRPRICRAAGGAVYRQRRDDRLGRPRTPPPRSHRRARCPGAPALAAR